MSVKEIESYATTSQLIVKSIVADTFNVDDITSENIRVSGVINLDGRLLENKLVTTLVPAAVTTLSATQLCDGLVVCTGVGTGPAITSCTGAQLDTFLGFSAVNGVSFTLTVLNQMTGVSTDALFNNNTGITFSRGGAIIACPYLTVGTQQSIRVFNYVRTGTAAYTVYA